MRGPQGQGARDGPRRPSVRQPPRRARRRYLAGAASVARADESLVGRTGGSMAERLLEVKGLKTHFFTDEGVVRAVDGISLYINKGETLGIVGESGSGKSVTALSVMRLIPQPPGRIVQGEIIYNGKNLLTLSPSQMRKIRGKEIAMIFQEPMTSLNPVFTVGEQIAEAIRLHEGLGRRDAMDKTVEMMKIGH